ncbi:MAG TPA: HEAT repeat domain-containing protein [Planctomycetota bacterium]|nr:HEAT repeat domain-containing protein [Planctomycetota bacterium]
MEGRGLHTPVTRLLRVAAAALLLGATTRAQDGAASKPGPAAPTAAAAARTAPSEEEISLAVADLAHAAELTDPVERALAVSRNAGVASPKVVKGLARFMKDKQAGVRLAAIDALGLTAHADALKELHRACQSDAKLREDVSLHAALLKAIGRHASPSSLKVLAEDAWKVIDDRVIQARLYAIGNIRTKAAVALLMELMNTDPTTPFQQSPYMEHFRVALAALSGVDQREDKEAWRAWWREAEASLKLAPEPRLPAELQPRWEQFWAPSEPAPEPAPAAGAEPAR